MSTVETEVAAAVAKAKAELAFVRLHWAALSGVVIAAAVVGFVVAKLL